jgi:hypothetical protein
VHGAPATSVLRGARPHVRSRQWGWRAGR